MTILSGDIKLLASDTMTDAAEGGGAMTGDVIVDNVSNNIFDDISTLDRVYGAVHQRKVFGAVQTQNADKYFGAHMIISKLPGDTKIGVNLFNTGDWFDRRDAAKSRVEAYLSKGPSIQAYLLGTQYQGSRLLSLFSGSSATFESGDVIILDDGVNAQYCRASAVSVWGQSFTDATGSFSRYIYSMEITSVLAYDFEGIEITRLDTVNAPTDIFKTVLSNAAKYYSARPLASLASAGDGSVMVDTIYTQLIPASQSETALIDLAAEGVPAAVFAASDSVYSYTESATLGANSIVYLGIGCVPGSLSITVSGGALTDYAGIVKSGSTPVATIDYNAGIIAFNADAPSYGGAKTISFTPGVNANKYSNSQSVSVTSGNRGYTWVISCEYAPQPGSVKISYMALNQWYDLHDDYSGGIVASTPNVGSGSVSYTTGSISLTTAVLPDVDSKIIISYTHPLDVHLQTLGASNAPTVNIPLSKKPLDLSTIALTWNDGAARTVTSNAAGILSGDGVGYIDVDNNRAVLRPTPLPPASTEISCDYLGIIGSSFDHGTHTIDSGNDGSSIETIDLGMTNVTPNTVLLVYEIYFQGTLETVSGVTTRILRTSSSDGTRIHLRDDGAGGFIGWDIGDASINYTTGIVSLKPNKTAVSDITTTRWTIISGHENYSYYARSWESKPCIVDHTKNDSVQFWASNVTATSVTDLYTVSSLILDLNNTLHETILKKSALFTIGAINYFDDNGAIKYGIDHATGGANSGGSIDYATGIATLTHWETGATNAVTLHALATLASFNPIYQSTFRTAQVPLKNSSFSVGFNLLSTNEHINVTAATNGVISHAKVTGTVYFDSGLVVMLFTEDVKAETITYNGVAYQYIPLSSEILGINPVRLPENGKVPVFQTGDVAVILHDQTTTGTYTSSSTTDLGRGRIAKLTIRDLGGNPLAVDKYSADLDTGIITWGDLTGVSQPLNIVDRIEDMAVVVDVQITGELALSTPLTHTFPADETLVSNAMIVGTLYAHVSIPFDQQTWTNVWSDELIGSSTAAQYNHSQYPVVVDNLSCIQERWAVIFTAAATFNLIGEHVGQIVTGASTAAPLAPINPETSLPYFTLPADGWGSGWSTGNVLRFNTLAANAPCWIIEAIGQGEATSTDYTFCLEFRGDIDTP